MLPALRPAGGRLNQWARSYATALTPDRSIYVSNSTNPYFNLSLEDWLFRHKPHKEPLLLIYRDEPCVVIGRNQNPWKEVNVRASRRTGIPFIRRRSGGGTVYHDLGNTNFSIHLPRTSFDRHATAQVILRAVRSLGINAHVNDRNDICVGKEKVSGSAYKIVNNRAYHHGTMLISTRLDMLGDLLHSDKETMHTKGVASVRSPVHNLQQFNPSVSHERFIESAVLAFREEYRLNDDIYYVDENEDTRNIDFIRDVMTELPSWDWAYGQTPEFTHAVQRSFAWGNTVAELHSKHGIIISCEFVLPDGVDPSLSARLKAMADRLKDQRYGFVDDSVIESEMRGSSELSDVWQWLRSEMDS